MKTLVKIGAAYFATGVAIVVVAIVKSGEAIQYFREDTDAAIMAAIRTSFVAPVVLVKAIITRLSKEED